MKNIIQRLVHIILAPIKLNFVFFIFMYFLGWLCSWETLPNVWWMKLYENLYLELFIDLYLAPQSATDSAFSLLYHWLLHHNCRCLLLH